MELCIKILVVLTIFMKLVSCQLDCDSNTYKNNPKLTKYLSGYLYNYETSQTIETIQNNAIYKFSPPNPITKTIFCRLTNDHFIGCCLTVTLSTVETNGYFPCQEFSDASCSRSLKNTAHMKLLAVSEDNPNGYCILVWTCQPKNEVLHTFCQSTHQTVKQRKWIADQYKALNLTSVTAKQNNSHKGAKCLNDLEAVST